MNRTSAAYARQFVHQVLNHRTVAVIQKYIVKRGKRTIVPQFFRGKGDEELFASWESDFDEIRRVFDVRYFTVPSGGGLTSPFHFQADHATSTDVGIPEVGDGVSNIRAAVSGVRTEPVDSHTTASDVDREGEDGRFRAVRNMRTLPVAE